MALKFQIDELLINTMVDAAEKGFALGGKKIECISIGKALPAKLNQVSGIIGVAGRVSGSIIVNLSEAVALQMASNLLQEKVETLGEDALDALGEVTNVIGGRLKSSLANSGYPLDNINLPSVIIGSDYLISHARGMLVFHTGYHVDAERVSHHADRVVHVAMTLMTSRLERTGDG